MTEEHIHDPLFGFGTIRCRTCGVLLPSVETQVSVAGTRKSAMKLLLNLAVDGRYTAVAMHDGFPMFQRTNNGLREEVYVVEEAKRRFVITKKIST